MKAKLLWSKLRDPGSVAETTCQVLLFAESFNTFCAHRAIKSPEKSLSTSSLLLAFRDYLSERDCWPEWTELVSFFKNAEVTPSYDQDIFDALLEVLFQPAIAEKDSQKRWKLSGSSRLPRTPLPAFLTHQTWIIEDQGGSFFTTFDFSVAGSAINAGRTRGWFWDQVLDPIATCHRVLIESISGRHSVARSEYILQRALKRYFGLGHFTNEIKYTLSDVTALFNHLFYTTSSLRVEEVQGIRSHTMSSRLVVNEFSRLLGEAQKGESASVIFKRALGIYLFARFCRVLRVRYFRLLESELRPSSVQLQRGDTVGQCLSAVRRLEFGYFLNRLFGSISEIPGLNFIFRGGILPRPDTGRVLVLSGPPGSGKTVFALQKLCGIAARGGLAVYFSFEERVDLLIDRLVIFGLLEKDQFDIIVGGEDIERHILERRSDGRGILALFTMESEAKYPLLDVIRRIGSQKPRLWRAVAIDSINALQLDAPSDGISSLSPSLDRVAARDLIEVIENNGFLGIILAEKTRGRFEELEYVADTVVRLGLSQGDRSRWLEIRKCRSQNFHGGRHKLRFIEGEGVSIIPSLGAIRSALRRRTKSTLSRERVISIPARVAGPVSDLAEKSSCLVIGQHGAGKTALLLRLATEPTRRVLKNGKRISVDPRAVLFISFKTTEESFLRAVRADGDIYAKWQRLKFSKVRWFSPGETITGDEVVWEIWQQIQGARRRGLGVERIVVDEIENAFIALPAVAKEPLFWTTLLQMTSAEAITTFLGISQEHGGEQSGLDSELLYTLRSEADYVVRVGSAEGDRFDGEEFHVPSAQAMDKGLGGRPASLICATVEKCPEEMRNSVGSVGQIKEEEARGMEDVGEPASKDGA